MSMSSYHRRILQKITPVLRDDLDPDDVTPYLVADAVLTPDDVEKINSKDTRKEKATELLNIIPCRGDSAYTPFKNSLKKAEGSMHLYDAMNSLEQEMSYEELEERSVGQDLQVTQASDTQRDVLKGGKVTIDAEEIEGSKINVAVKEGPSPGNANVTMEDSQLTIKVKGKVTNSEIAAQKLTYQK